MKKINKFIKILLVLCLTVTQFIPLIDVKALEDIQSTANVIKDNNKYYAQFVSNEIYEPGTYYFSVNGKYTFLDGTTTIIAKTITDGVNETNINGYKIPLDEYYFDGEYELSINLYKENGIDDTLIASVNDTEVIEYPFGLEVIATPNVVENSLSINSDNKNVDVALRILPGKLSPNEKYTIPFGIGLGKTYTGIELNGSYVENIVGDVDYTNYLYSTYTYNYALDLIIDSTSELLTLENNYSLRYGEIADNDDYLNSRQTLNMNFSSGIVTLQPYNNNTQEADKITIQNVIDDISTNAYFGRNYKYVVKDSTDNIITDYSRLIQNDMVLEITYEGVTLSYKVNFAFDYNNDSYLDENDLLPGIEEIITKEEDIDDNVLETTTVINKINNEWKETTDIITPTFEGNDNVNIDDEFVLTYEVSGLTDDVVNAFGGILNYDSEKIELVSITANDNWVGAINLTNNKVLFASTTGSPNGIILKITFKALSEGTANVSLSNVSIAINNVISNDEVTKYDLSKDIKILSNYGVGGDEVVLTPTVNNEQKTVEEKLITKEEVTEELNTLDKEQNKKDSKATTKEKEGTVENSKTSRIVIVILIVLVIAGLVYLIFKDDEEETKGKSEKEINKK